jgi:glutathione S-transferase
MLTIYGNDHSSCTQKVIWCAEELGLAYRLIDKGGSFGGLGDPEYVKLNPNRLIPTIDDDGFVLWESGAILCYLASRYGKGTLYPSDDHARGEAYRWVLWQTGTVRSAIMPLYVQWRVWKPAYRHLDELERARRAMEPIWRVVETQLETRSWLAGDAFSMADIPMGIMAHWWYSFPIEHFELPHLAGWHRRLLRRPAFQRSVVQPLAHAD